MPVPLRVVDGAVVRFRVGGAEVRSRLGAAVMSRPGAASPVRSRLGGAGVMLRPGGAQPVWLFVRLCIPVMLLVRLATPVTLPDVMPAILLA